jgi:hypothetical protein
MPKQQNDIAIRLYFERSLYESARIIGYNGISPFDFWDKAKALTVRIKGDNGKEKQVPFVGTPDAACTEAQVKHAVEELTKWEKREGPNPVYELKPAVRRACTQLLGPAPEHPFREFLLHGPPDIMGEDNVTRWQEQYRKRKEADAEAQEQPKKRTRKGRNR